MNDVPTLESLSETMQMYLKAIHEIQTKKGAARVTDIATNLGVRKGSVSVALRSLSERGLVNYAPYDVVTLTDPGHAVADELDRRYDVLQSFFVSVLGIDADRARDEACDLEHHISSELHDRLVGFVEYYQNCASTKFRWNPELGGFCVDPDDE
jgi:DtxR family Mn-dependent transcriptional regulator